MNDYAGDISARDGFELLKQGAHVKLIDVRTQAEWAYVGVPDLSSLEKQPLLVAWQIYPNMILNQSFAEQLRAHGINESDTLLLICRSGVRSKAAAQLLTSLGFSNCYNIIDGFEGPLDENRHRGGVAGWKAEGLPWTQG